MMSDERWNLCISFASKQCRVLVVVAEWHGRKKPDCISWQHHMLHDCVHIQTLFAFCIHQSDEFLVQSANANTSICIRLGTIKVNKQTLTTSGYNVFAHLTLPLVKEDLMSMISQR